MIYKRKRWLVLALIIVALFCCGCSKIPQNGTEEGYSFSVNVLDVGEGDCIFIEFPDGKNMLIDCGEGNDKNFSNINKFFSANKVDKIDYLIITHPDLDHAGGALNVVENYKINRAYLPDLDQNVLNFYKAYADFYSAILKTDVEICYSDYYDFIKGEDYFVTFLTPTPRAISDSEYVEINGAVAPSETQSNAVSPIIYAQIYGFRFIFAGDAPARQEKKALENVRLLKSYYQNLGVEVNLQFVDYLKVSHHGSDDASCQEFLDELCPKNAIISVGGNNLYGHPTTKVLNRLQTANPDYVLYRTDVHGNVCVRGDWQTVYTKTQIK